VIVEARDRSPDGAGRLDQRDGLAAQHVEAVPHVGEGFV